MIARAASGLVVSALIRRVTQDGGFAAVLARGDATAGGILLVCTERGAVKSLIEQGHGPDGTPAWRSTGHRVVEGGQDLAEYQRRRRSSDPDLWIVELDIPDAERFAAVMIGGG